MSLIFLLHVFHPPYTNASLLLFLFFPTVLLSTSTFFQYIVLAKDVKFSLLYFSSFFFLIFIYLFLAVLGLLCELGFCARAFSCCGKWGPLFITVRGPLNVAASLVVGHKLQTRRLSSCGSRAQLIRGMWDLPRPELEPMSPALAGRFSTTEPPGKPLCLFFLI